MRLLTSAAMVLLTTACAGPTVITSDNSVTPTAAAPPPPTTTKPSNAHLANAFDFAADVAGRTGYYFVSPSGRWKCAIIPRASAGCQNANGTALNIDGTPDSVTGIVVDRTADATFVTRDEPGFALEPGPATELPFNRILAVGGFRCNIQEASGISCLSELSGKGFTFSAEGFITSYTDVPADAP
ncbi:hypothetical protein [Mycobacterium sp. 236(2023)]|uniref:hypothetical protein n=1 Tax=Mycobacterium sp. 236(2023) TaxID=3038163 RepID=UPI00241547CD|nr:hypothetical protein [Mycobacterium sp. 236(2023)]MDG4666859.1 hypothetical protein [Mycobacterium sp. 236(2023)]